MRRKLQIHLKSPTYHSYYHYYVQYKERSDCLCNYGTDLMHI